MQAPGGMSMELMQKMARMLANQNGGNQQANNSMGVDVPAAQAKGMPSAPSFPQPCMQQAGCGGQWPNGCGGMPGPGMPQPGLNMGPPMNMPPPPAPGMNMQGGCGMNMQQGCGGCGGCGMNMQGGCGMNMPPPMPPPMAPPMNNMSPPMNLPAGMVLSQVEGLWRSDGSRIQIDGHGYATYDGEHYNGLDLIQQGQLIGREDGWQVCPFTSNNVQLVWKKRGNDDLIWKKETEEDLIAERFRVQDVKEVCERYKISPDLSRQLEEQLRGRPQSFEGDLETIDDALSGAKMPGAVLMLKLKEMSRNTFCGMPANFKLIQSMATKYGLEPEAMNAMTRALVPLGKAKSKLALSHLDSHLERSNTTSATVLEKIPMLKAGQEIGIATHAAVQGSQLWEMQKMGEDMQRDEEERRRKADDSERIRQLELQKEYERRNERDQGRGDRDDRGGKDRSRGRRDSSRDRRGGGGGRDERRGGDRDGGRGRGRDSRDKGRKEDDRDRGRRRSRSRSRSDRGRKKDRDEKKSSRDRDRRDDRDKGDKDRDRDRDRDKSRDKSEKKESKEGRDDKDKDDGDKKEGGSDAGKDDGHDSSGR